MNNINQTSRTAFSRAAAVTAVLLSSYLLLGSAFRQIDKAHADQGNPHIDLTHHSAFGGLFAPFDYKPR